MKIFSLTNFDLLFNRKLIKCTLEIQMEGAKAMPNYYFREFWTPLSLTGIKLFKDDEGVLWIKYWGYKRRRLRKTSELK
ncbi:hypothetical protein J2Z65_001500 [Paenibacillus aceris]|uniref:Uncharacterized protein n=1 Tax=Paenibacillus aceris TaxID=869555 RepID=A0ABS4HVQ3_9BACL|nr:hypothetical protein [Paenibacillus aceris]